MNKRLLFAAILASGSTICIQAETQVFTTDELGEVSKISDNGKYAAITDIENNIAWLWDRETGTFTDISAPLGDPENTPSAKCVTGTTAMDVTDDGIVVGSVIFRDGHQVPAYRVDGEWCYLELHPGARNTNEAIAVTPDGKTIAGYQFIIDQSSAIGGRYYPTQWKLDGDEYVMHAYTDIELPNHQGFYPTAQTSDGRVVCGQIFAGVDSTVPGLIVDGELKVFDTFETRQEPFEFAGRWFCGNDENGNQIWTRDPEDPRIQLFTEYYINGYHDTGDHSLLGGLANCDNQGHFYGMRTQVKNADEEGNATLTDGAAIYNINTDEWTYNTSYRGFAAGLDGNYIMTIGSTVLVDGQPKEVTDEFGFSTSRSLAYLNSYSDDGLVVGGMTYEVNPANGENQYFPLILVLDKAIVGIQSITGGTDGEPYVIVSEGRIDVAGASSVAVYDLEGKLAGASDSVSVAPGIYIVKADGISRKVVVR